MSLVKHASFLLAMGLGQALTATAFGHQVQEVEVTIFYSADICGYLEPCG